MSQPEQEAETSSDLADAMDRELRFARILEGKVVVTWWLVGSTVLMWFAALIVGLGLGFKSTELGPDSLVFYTGMKVNRYVADGQWWRLLSSMWVHLGFAHIAFNAYGLYVLGPILEKFYGARRYFALYLASGLIAAGCSYWFNDVPSGGASGAIYGLVGALLVFGYKYRGDLPPRVSRAFTTGMLPWVALSIGIGFIDAIPFDNAAHLGGLFSGAVLAVVTGTRLERPTTKVGNWILWALTVVGLALVVYTGVAWSQEASRCLDSRADYVQCYPELAKTIHASTSTQE